MSTEVAALRKALASTPRPPRASAVSAALAFGWRGMLKVKHVPEQLLDVTITPVMFVLMFTYLFGGEVAGSTGEYLDEADQLADGIAVIDHGKVIAEGTPAQLKASVGSGALHVRLLDPEQRPEAERVLARELGSVHLEPDPAALSAACAGGERAAAAVAELARSGIGIGDFSLGQPTLDEVFLALTGHTAADQSEDSSIPEEQPA